MKLKLDAMAIMPTRSHETDAGLDLYATRCNVIPAHGSQVFCTGVHVQLPPGTTGFVKSRSGLMFRDDITTDGTIDEGYTGDIRVKLFNHGNHEYMVQRGDKIAQLVIVEVCKPTLVEVDELDESDRGTGGFGSTGR